MIAALKEAICEMIEAKAAPLARMWRAPTKTRSRIILIVAAKTKKRKGERELPKARS